MEAIEFLKEYKRMCTECKSCLECPLAGTTCSIDSELSERQMINIIDATERWNKEHQIITNAQKFKEVFGFLPDGDVIFSKDYFINAVKGPVLKWDEPYEGAEI